MDIKDLKRLKPILESAGNFGALVPNMSYYIFKNRGGKWKTIIIWTKLNMGTMREVDCFVTDYNYDTDTRTGEDSSESNGAGTLSETINRTISNKVDSYLKFEKIENIMAQIYKDLDVLFYGLI